MPEEIASNHINLSSDEKLVQTPPEQQSQVHGAQFTVSVLSEEEHEASRVTTAEVPTDQSIVPIRSGSQSERGQSYHWLPP